MDYEKVFGWGLAIYAIMFLFWSAMIAYGLSDSFASQIVGLMILIGIAYRAGLALKLHAWKNILPYSIGWLIVVAVLDMITSVPFTGWQIFIDPNLWISYIAILVAPLFAGEDAAPAHGQ